MSVTVENMFNIAMSLCDYIDSSGNLINTDTVEILKNRAPALCTMAQREVSLLGLEEHWELLCSGEPVWTRKGQKAFFIGKDVLTITDITYLSGTRCDKSIVIKNGLIIVPEDFSETLFCVGKRQPNVLTTFYDVLSVQDGAAISVIPYYLAADYLLEENPVRSLFFRQQYKNAIESLSNMQCSKREEPITDLYNTALRGEIDV